VRQQEQSFNVIDIGEGSVTVTVHGWNGEQFSAKDANHYDWQNGKWKLREDVEPAR
jgi:hypothetical protein